MFGNFRTSDFQSVTSILHLGQTLLQGVQFLRNLVRPGVADEGEAIVHLPQKLAHFEGGVDVPVAHAVDAHPHELPGEVGHAQQVVHRRDPQSPGVRLLLQGIRRGLARQRQHTRTHTHKENYTVKRSERACITFTRRYKINSRSATLISK